MWLYIFRAGGIEQGSKTRQMRELNNKPSLNHEHLSTTMRAVRGASLVRLQPAWGGALGGPSELVLR
jgi:hypothetical protein